MYFMLKCNLRRYGNSYSFVDFLYFFMLKENQLVLVDLFKNTFAYFSVLAYAISRIFGYYEAMLLKS